ncbi:MAG: aminoglycoside 3'-phosphotransferase [Christensenellales bacterium]
MNEIIIEAKLFPAEILPYIEGSRVFDYSSSKRAKTYFLDKDDGYFLKIGARGALEQEALMMRHLSKLGFTARVLQYVSGDGDFFLMEKVQGEPCSASKYLDCPEAMVKIISENLRRLHDSPTEACPFNKATSSLIPAAIAGLKSGRCNRWMIKSAGFSGPEDAYNFIKANADKLVEDTIIHGDACLPNIILRDFDFSGFIDFEGGGMGDRHHDLLWAIWSLEYNLKMDKYRETFLRSYGDDAFDSERYKLCCAINGLAWED